MRHLLFTATYRDGATTDNDLVEMLWGALDAAGATVVNKVVHKFYPMGITAVAVLAESHASVHTWPENGFAKVDYFSCSNDPKFDEFEDYFFMRGFGIADKLVIDR
jgi:S-adenosylmethionine decarboxylase